MSILKLLGSSRGSTDFAIHGVLKYHLFGQELWIGDTIISLWVVMLVLIIFALFARRALNRATDVPGPFQNVKPLKKWGEVSWEKMHQDF